MKQREQLLERTSILKVVVSVRHSEISMTKRKRTKKGRGNVEITSVLLLSAT